MQAVLPRIVLGYLLALPFIAAWVAHSIDPESSYTFALRMSSSTGGVLQIFFNVGQGFSETDARTTPLIVSDEASEYRLPLPSATYHSLRIDPGTGAGTYTIERADILREDGSLLVTIPLTELQVLQQLTVLERTPARLVLRAPEGSNDPILVWVPPSPFSFALQPSETSRAAQIALIWLTGTVIAWGAPRILRAARPPCTRLLEWASAVGTSNPRSAIVVIAVLATVVATYPVVFDSRSLASPNNGGLMMLYEQPPFVPGSADHDIEDTRGADVGPMMWQSLPHSRVQREALANWEIPLWNRYNALGRPLWGQGLSYILDPAHWLTIIVGDAALGWDLKFVAHRFLFASGVGLASLTATGAWLPAAIAAAAAPFAGAFTFRVNHPAIFSLAYAPWTLLGWFLLAKAAGAPALARAAIVLTVSSCLLLVAPTPKEGAIALLGISATGALGVLMSPGSYRLRCQRLAAATVAGVATVLLSAPHWVVFLDTLRTSAHAYEAPSVQVAGLVHALAVFSSPITPLPGLHLFALVLVTAAVTAPRLLWSDRLAFACAIGAALLAGVAFGIVPASSLIEIPLLGNIGHFGDVFLMASMAPLLIVCAAGARVLWNASWAHTVAVMIGVGAVASWLFTQTSKLAAVESLEAGAIGLLVPLAVCWPACLFSARRQSAIAFVVASGAMATLLLPGGLHLETGARGIDRLLLQPRLRPPLNQSSPAIEAIHAATITPTRTTGVALTLFPGTPALYGLEDLRGVDPLEVLAHRELLDASGMQRSLYWLVAFAPTDLPRLNPILDMLNVGFLVARPDGVPPGSQVLPMTAPDLVRAIQRPTAWPRAFFIDGVATYTTPANLLEQVRTRPTPFAAILEGDARAADAMRGLPLTIGSAIPADSYVLTANTSSFRVRADKEGLAVLGETFLPDDFVATLNGAHVPYFRVNHVFKAVRIPGAGEWNVRFEYRPRRWRASLGAAGVGALILLALASIALRKRA